MAFLNNIENLRTVEWSKGFLWDVRFYNTPTSKGGPVPKPFDDWFPATSVDDQTADVEIQQEETPHGVIAIPKKGGLKKIKLTFIDAADHRLERFFEDWIKNQVLNRYAHTSTTAEAAKYLEIARLNTQREIILTKTYIVIPEGGLNYDGSDKADPNSYSMNFVKVGEIGL